MKFLCDHHRQRYVNDPQAALNFWAKTLGMARAKAACSSWGEASLIYGNAYEAAQILLDTDACPGRALTRYLQTATEFAFSLRKNTCVNELGQLGALMRDQLRFRLSKLQLEACVGTLMGVATLPEADVDEWIDTTLSMEAARVNTLH